MKYILKFGSFLLYFAVVSSSLLRGSPPPPNRRECCLGELAMKNFPVELHPPQPPVCFCWIGRYLGQRQRAGVSGQGQLHGGLPDPRLVQSLGRNHELDGLGQVGHVLLGVHRPIGSHAEVGVVGHEPHLPGALAVLELHWIGGRGGGEKGAELESHMWKYLVLSAAIFDEFAQTIH